MKETRVADIKLGDFLAENVYRHDGLLAMPNGLSVKDNEKNHLKELRVSTLLIESFEYDKKYENKETLEVIFETIDHSNYWDKRTTAKIKRELKNKFNKKKKILDLMTELREVDYYSFVSSVNISIIVGEIMFEGKVNKTFIDFMFLAMIHDIGKLKVTKYTLQKKELSESEFRAVRNHPTYSYEILQELGFTRKEVLFVSQTHEKWDGNGYPNGIEGREIQPFSQILAIIEMYNAMVSPRPHRPPFHLIDVLDKIRQEEGHSFGSDYIEFFENNFRPYKVGMYVELNNGMIGRITKINERNLLFPELRLYDVDTGEEYTTVNLYHAKELRITKIINKLS